MPTPDHHEEVHVSFDVAQFFAPGGPLASTVGERYRYRCEQVRLATQIHDALGGAVVLADAKTGVGKSFAYLVPLLLSGEPLVISTCSKVLQRQLIEKDLPTLVEALEVVGAKPPSYALLKGRQDFLCPRRLEEFRTEDMRSHTDEAFEVLEEWARTTETGDLEELSIPAPAWWPEVAADRDDCKPNTCPECFYFKHRLLAAEADVFVVNHHLLVANIGADGQLFGLKKRHLVVDEAHQLAPIMRESLGATLTRKRINYICSTVERRVVDIGELTGNVRSCAGSFFDELAASPGLHNEDGAPPSYRSLSDALELLRRRLRTHPREEVNQLAPMVARFLIELRGFYRPEEPAFAYAVEEGSRGAPALKMWLVEPAEAFSETVLKRADDKATVLTSATLAVGKSFEHIRGELGIDFSESTVLEHLGSEIFDFSKNALVYVANDLPAPARNQLEAHTGASIVRAAELVQMSRGRALVLCATTRAVRSFRAEFDDLVHPHPVRYQGDDSPAKLTQWLKGSAGGVLVATRSFWQGVDIPGEALSLVVLDKVPFAPPGDPVFEKLKAKAGREWFVKVMLPEAQKLVQQGAGRLIRSDTDRGVIALLDPRISSKPWGRSIVRCLPDGAPVTVDPEDVRAFFGDSSLSSPAAGSSRGAQEVIAELRGRGVALTAAAGKIRLKPRDLVTAELLEELESNKTEIFDFLVRESELSSSPPA
jgi:ATP-dependent DNA helicase DinG